jgi:hypothetical protein
MAVKKKATKKAIAAEPQKTFAQELAELAAKHKADLSGVKVIQRGERSAIIAK